jgi:hypothetical protein
MKITKENIKALIVEADQANTAAALQASRNLADKVRASESKAKEHGSEAHQAWRLAFEKARRSSSIQESVYVADQLLAKWVELFNRKGIRK